MNDWSIGVNGDGELYVMHNDEPVVGFTADYTFELYLALHSYFVEKNGKMN